MATEKISWNSIVGGSSAPLPDTLVDNGEVIADVSGNAQGSGSVVVNTSASDPPVANDSLLDMTNASTSTTTLMVNFADDTTSAGAYGAYDAQFTIYDIDAGSYDGFRDQVTILALDADGNPLDISIHGMLDGNYSITGNPDGSVTLTGDPYSNSYNSIYNTADVTVNGGPIASIQVNFSNIGTGQNNIQLTDICYSTQVICFTAGTQIETIHGEVSAEDLQVGDMVRTMDNGYQEVRWIGVNSLSAQTLQAASWMRPVRISAGALGDGTPKQDLVVSPQHRVLVRSRIAQKMFGTDEVLVPAKQLVILDGIDICDDLDGVTYVHFLCNQHEVVFANGAASESLFTGAEALKSVGSEARAEIFALFPELQDIDYNAQSARTLTSGRLGRKLAHRHAQNSKPLVTPTPHA